MESRDTRPVIVVPCFNEERRIDEAAFLSLARTARVRLLFVDDGSTDGTAEVLSRMSQTSEAVEIFSLASNMGKAEAVRCGLLMAVRTGATVVGYYDADLATPADELARLTETLRPRPDLAGALGCRVARLGSSIDRKVLRHYAGRIYASVASLALGTAIYDTQCGAKVFRVSHTFVAALAEPFRSSWSFDVELLDRLLRGSGEASAVAATSFVEVPLNSWHDVDGSKLGLRQGLSAFADVIVIARDRRRREAAVAKSTAGRTSLPQPAVMVPHMNEPALPAEPDGRSRATPEPVSRRQA